jgi:RND family efflux transporter MFP subunit
MMNMNRARAYLGAGFAAALLAAGPLGAAELELVPTEIVETKAVYGRIETRDVVPARSRIGGTLVDVTVTEGDTVIAGQMIARVVDDKLALQLRAADAKIRALTSELDNIRLELDRAQTLLARGSTTQQRVDQLRTQLAVLGNQIAAAEAEKSVVLQQAREGDVLAPIAGRVLRAPVTRGAVVQPGEQAALIGGGGLFLRLALPERHAADLRSRRDVGVRITRQDGGGPIAGRVAKVFPQIENGRVIVDIEIPAMDDYFVGARVLVHVPVGTRSALVAPANAVRTVSGVDYVQVATPSGPRLVAVVLGSTVPLPGGAPGVEILSGVVAGDRLVHP